MGKAAEFGLKVWAIVIFIGPFIVGLMDSSWFFGEFFFLAMLYGMFFSIPAFFIFLLITVVLNKQAISLIYKKMILAAIGFVLTFITFIMFGGIVEEFWIAYCIIVVIAILFLKLDPSIKSREDDTESSNQNLESSI